MFLFLIIFFILKLGEKLDEKEVDIVVKDCMDPEDEDGFIPYAREYNLRKQKNNNNKSINNLDSKMSDL